MKRFFSSLKHHKKRVIPLVIVLIILGFIFFPKPPQPLETQKVKEADLIESLTTTGSVSSDSTVELNFLTSGKVVTVGAKKGDLVEAGQVLATLDQRTTQKNLQSALIDYSKQRNTFEQTKDNNNDNTPQTALNESMKRVLENNQYDLDKAILSVELQTLIREQSVLTSPISGIVTQADITTPGVSASVTDIFKITDPTTLLFKMDIDEADIGKVHTGQSVKVTFDAYPDDTFEVTVDSIDFASHTTASGGNAFTVDAALPANSKYSYRVGMNGDGEVILDEKNDVLVVSLASLTEDNAVYVKKGDVFEKRKIKTGIQSDTEVEVVKGLKKDEEVALQPDEAANRIKNTKKFFGLF